MIGGKNANLVPFESAVVKALEAEGVLGRSHWEKEMVLWAVVAVAEWRIANLVVRVVGRGLGADMALGQDTTVPVEGTTM